MDNVMLFVLKILRHIRHCYIDFLYLHCQQLLYLNNYNTFFQNAELQKKIGFYQLEHFKNIFIIFNLVNKLIVICRYTTPSSLKIYRRHFSNHYPVTVTLGSNFNFRFLQKYVVVILVYKYPRRIVLILFFYIFN